MAILWVFTIHYSLFTFYKPFECLFDKNRLSPVRNGDMGVDVFFVLSGFLITDILIRELMRDGDIEIFHFLR
jgi:peptidoglycan/LPS O-acetylase OafA/YrhL